MKPTIKIAAVISFVANIDSIISLVNRVVSFLGTQNNKNNQILINMDYHIVFQLISIIGVFGVVYYLISRFENIQKKMEASNIVNYLRTKHLFIRDFDNIEYYRLPNETDDELFKRLPQGEFNQYLNAEYTEAKNFIIHRLNITPKEATEVLDSVYGIRRKQKETK